MIKDESIPKNYVLIPYHHDFREDNAPDMVYEVLTRNRHQPDFFSVWHNSCIKFTRLQCYYSDPAKIPEDSKLIEMLKIIPNLRDFQVTIEGHPLGVVSIR